MAARPPAAERRRRPRGGSLERPVNARMYRGTWLLVGIPVLVASLGVARAEPLPRPVLPPAFDGDRAVQLTRELAGEHPDRVAGTAQAEGATRWVVDQLRSLGLTPRRRPFTADVAGRGRTRLVNVVASVPGRSGEAVVVMAHRDNLGVGPGANDNASGTAALVEIARTYALLSAPRADAGETVVEPPARTLVFVSTDGGAAGGLGAAAFVRRPGFPGRIAAALVLDSLGGRGAPRLQVAGDEPRSAPPDLVESLAVRVLEQTGERPARPSGLRQLLDLAFPLTFYEQGPLIAAGIPAVTLTADVDAARPDFGDSPSAFTGAQLGGLGRAAQSLVATLEEGAEFGRDTGGRLYLGPRAIDGWAVQLLLLATLLPFFAAVVDLFARCRRRRIALAPALRSYGRRLAFWLSVAATWAVLDLLGSWPDGAPHPPAATAEVATDWALLPLAVLGSMGVFLWLVSRDGLFPRTTPTAAEELGGYTAALLVLGVLALVVVTLNTYALILLLPSLHAWLWLPQMAGWPRWMRAGVLLLGLAGPALVLASVAGRLGLGADAPWYVLTLLSVGYVEPTSALVALAWAAAAAQVVALATHRYAPAGHAGGRGRGVARRLASALRRPRSSATVAEGAGPGVADEA